MQPVKWLNELGLRATYGITGNSPYLGAASVNDILRVVSASYKRPFSRQRYRRRCLYDLQPGQ